MNKKNLLGFTLIEILIAVAIISILAAIALPLYTAQTQKARRTDARAALSAIALAQERFYTVNGVYSSNFSTLDLSNINLRSVANNVVVSEGNYYNITFSSVNNTAFALNASALNSQAGDTDCAWFALNQLGVKTALNANNTNCW